MQTVGEVGVARCFDLRKRANSPPAVVISTSSAGNPAVSSQPPVAVGELPTAVSVIPIPCFWCGETLGCESGIGLGVCPAPGSTWPGVALASRPTRASPGSTGFQSVCSGAPLAEEGAQAMPPAHPPPPTRSPSPTGPVVSSIRVSRGVCIPLSGQSSALRCPRGLLMSDKGLCAHRAMGSHVLWIGAPWATAGCTGHPSGGRAPRGTTRPTARTTCTARRAAGPCTVRTSEGVHPSPPGRMAGGREWCASAWLSPDEAIRGPPRPLSDRADKPKGQSRPTRSTVCSPLLE